MLAILYLNAKFIPVFIFELSKYINFFLIQHRLLFIS